MRARTMGWAVTALALSATAGCDRNSEQPRPSQQPASTSPGVGSAKPTPASTLPNTDLERLTELAKKVLTFCQNKDVEALVLMFQEGEREAAKKSFTPGEPRYESFFADDSWRWKVVRDWGDDLQEVRVKGDRARVKFANVDDKSAAVVEFARADGMWSFQSIENPSLDELAHWGEAAK